jgi:hypothetical protein
MEGGPGDHTEHVSHSRLHLSSEIGRRFSSGVPGYRGSGRPVFAYARQKRRKGGERDGRREMKEASEGSRG